MITIETIKGEVFVFSTSKIIPVKLKQLSAMNNPAIKVYKHYKCVKFNYVFSHYIYEIKEQK